MAILSEQLTSPSRVPSLAEVLSEPPALSGRSPSVPFYAAVVAPPPPRPLAQPLENFFSDPQKAGVASSETCCLKLFDVFFFPGPPFHYSISSWNEKND